MINPRTKGVKRTRFQAIIYSPLLKTKKGCGVNKAVFMFRGATPQKAGHGGLKRK
jgi:hypothetical protein